MSSHARESFYSTILHLSSLKITLTLLIGLLICFYLTIFLVVAYVPSHTVSNHHHLLAGEVPPWGKR